MKKIALLAGLLASTAAVAQAPTPPQPVENSQAPENQVLNPEQRSTAQTPARANAPASTPAKPDKWDVNAPPGLTLRQVPINVAEGSWMNVDVSPDGRTIAFDLLGDIYTMPIGGGTPTRIAEGLAFEHQPRFSPDGRRIAFVSDRAGGDNVWIMNVDGSDKRQVTKEDFRLLNQPSWSPDGRFIVAKKHFTTGRSLGTGEVWMYHVSGGGGVPLVKRPNEQHQKELGEPIFAPDGKSVYFTRNVTPGPIFEYAQNSNTDLFHIERYDLETGETATVARGAGGSVRPTPSPDGRKIAFVRRERTRSKLYVKDLASGEERKIYDALDQDVQETWAVTGVYPNMSWTPDGRSVLFWAGGKIRRVNADGSGAAEIPFRVNDTRVVADALHPRVEVAPDRFTTKIPRWAAVSPDGRQVVFETLGKLWIKPMAGGAARRLTSGNGDSFELHPAWSRDGKTIAYVDWTDQGLGRLRTVGANGGSPRDVTQQPGHYANPAFSPDGRTIVFERRSGGYLTSDQWSESPGVYRVAASGGVPARVAKDGVSPQFGASNDRLFMVITAQGKRQLVSTDLNGEAKRVHSTGELVNDFDVSPDGRLLAFRQNYQAFVMPLMPGTQDVSADPKGGPLPVTRVSSDGADFIHWSDRGRKLHWSLGPTLYTATADAFFPSAPAGENAPKFQPPRTGVSLAMEVAADKPSGTVALTGARIVTMANRDGGIIDDGVIVVRGDRIVAVGPRASMQIPAGARTVDLAGKTIIPGLVDAHAHGPQGTDGMVPQQNWSSLANLAMGTTTIHDPSAQASVIFAASEMQRAGKIVAPRIFSTGEIIYGAKAAGTYADINSFDDAIAHVRRLKAQGAMSVKNYNQPRREQRQMVVAAAQREGMEVVPEGGSLFTQGVTLIQDGNATIEHNIPLRVFYDDLVQLWTQSKTNYTPTLVVTFGGPAGDPYWRSHTDVFRHPILTRHIPPATLAADNARREIAPDEDYVDDDSARESKKLADKGVLVSIGAHGQQAGLGPHWEMWSFARGGWSPVEALRAGTIDPARSLGYDRDVGSLEPGKLADLVVLDADPTQDIRNTEKVHRVMLGGRMYDPMTMNEVVTGTRTRQPYWWEGSGGTRGAGSASQGFGHGHD
ncbi:amidohydrolase family protein [Sphingomonas sp.]|jgi:imidazolonepropionase-like amidohydrolase/Tol biopolymer transport system component|uniref:amidohydrolase family protein n=1 Tax=Sphingomonas sp. TaxID=28214 RepID=UPI002DEF124E|nr:amidohydrolase family protein [Sphingomonas sp.]HEV2568054.1 amidohydrolase family protein [Sphingomonas sp.]